MVRYGKKAKILEEKSRPKKYFSEKFLGGRGKKIKIKIKKRHAPLKKFQKVFIPGEVLAIF